MSLILDALRKSEAERRRGQSPDLFAATPGLASSRTDRARVWPLLLLAAMLLASAWLIWRSGDRAPDGTTGPMPAAELTPVAPRVIIVPAPPPPPAHARAGATTTSPSTTQAPPPPQVPTQVAPPLPLPPPANEDVPVEPELPPVAVLDAATRAALPPLKLTMHVYADEPARRFAIIDGQRVAEGSHLGPGVVLQIRRDGVVVEIDGQRVLIAKP